MYDPYFDNYIVTFDRKGQNKGLRGIFRTYLQADSARPEFFDTASLFTAKLQHRECRFHREITKSLNSFSLNTFSKQSVSLNTQKASFLVSMNNYLNNYYIHITIWITIDIRTLEITNYRHTYQKHERSRLRISFWY